MRIIAYTIEISDKKVLLTESTGEHIHSNDFEELTNFLMEQYEETIKICWNLNETIAPLLKLMGERTCKRLHENKRCYYAPYNLFYVPDKVLSVQHIPTKDKFNLYGIDQYYPEIEQRMGVEKIAQLGQYLLQELHKMGLYPDKLTSPITIYEQCILSHINMPTRDDMPKEAAKLAYLCSGKLWIEAYTLGFFP